MAVDTTNGASQLFQDTISVITGNIGTTIKQNIRQIGQMSLDRAGAVKGQEGDDNATKCFEPLGCLEINEKWYSINRPVNMMPQPRQVINTQFILRTRKAYETPVLLNASHPNTILRSTFNGSNPTILIVHGFIDTGFVPWIVEMSEKLLLVENVNVIAVDWGGGSASMYSQSAANTRLVALEISFLLQHLMENHGSKVEEFYIIGHSLGSHIAGYAGEDMERKTGRKIGRITGMDPAEPLFESTPAYIRLDPTDAEFVDVIHTDAKSLLVFGYGMVEPVGHVDFYPNGGNGQPGCSMLDVPAGVDTMVDPEHAFDAFGRHMVACSHMRAVELYIESLDHARSPGDTCPMVGYECTSYEEFTEGLCFECGSDGKQCAKVGYSAIDYKSLSAKRKQTNLKFFFNTGRTKPFCQYHYLIGINLANPKSAETWVQGHLNVNLHGSRGEIIQHELTPDASVRLYHGTRKGFLLPLDSDLGLVDIVNLRWDYDHEIDPLDLAKVCVLLCTDTVNVQNLTVTSLDQPKKDTFVASNTVTVCGDNHGLGYSVIKSSEWKMFYKSCSNATTLTD